MAGSGSKTREMRMTPGLFKRNGSVGPIRSASGLDKNWTGQSNLSMIVSHESNHKNHSDKVILHEFTNGL